MRSGDADSENVEGVEYEGEALRRRLEETAKEEAEILARVAKGGDAPGVDRVHTTLSNHWSSTPNQRRSRWVPVAWMTLAAAAGWLLLMSLRSEPLSGKGPTDTVLSGRVQGVVAPKGEVTGYEQVAWDVPSAPGRWFLVRVLDASGARSLPIFESSRLGQSPLKLPAESQGWPPRITVELEVSDGEGFEPRIFRAEATRGTPP